LRCALKLTILIVRWKEVIDVKSTMSIKNVLCVGLFNTPVSLWWVCCDYRSAQKMFDEDHYRRFLITVRNNGTARWQPGGVYAISCDLEMDFYPFDDQRCTMEVETWVYTADKVNLTNRLNEIGRDTYVEHGEWTIISTELRSENKVSYDFVLIFVFHIAYLQRVLIS